MVITPELHSANEYFANQEFEKACSLYEEYFPSNIGGLTSLLSSNQVLAHIFRNYLYCLREAGQQNRAIKLLYEIRAFSPKNTFIWETRGITRDSLLENNSQPLLSIIVPIYNSGQYLDHCIQSIRSQSYTNFELILVNDGSSDSSAEIIAQHAESDSRIKVITNEKASGNPGTPRNQALDIATGDYVGFVDSDDWINNDFYSQLMGLALKNNADIAFSGGFYNHLSNGQVNKRTYSTIGFEDPTSPRFKTHDSFMIWDKIFKRSLLEMFDIRLGETKAAVDAPFVFAAYYYAATIAFNDDYIGYNYRRESESSVTVAHRKGSNCEFEFQAFSSVRDWSEKNDIASYYDSVIDIKLVSSLMYTLKMVSESYFEGVFGRVKEVFKPVNRSLLREYCIAGKKWWQFKEFEFVLNHSATEVRQFLKDKEEVAQEKAFAKLIAPRFILEGRNPGIIFFPCWLVNNPYQKLFYEALHKEFDLSIQGFDQKALCREVINNAKGKFKFIHLHWLHNFFDENDPSVLANTIDTLTYAKELGFEIIYTAHNIVSHDSDNPALEREFRAKILNLVDHSLAHGNFAKQKLQDEFDINACSIDIVPHGTYGDFYGDLIDKSVAKEKFGVPVDSTVFLFFGNIKGYKGIFNLLTSFENLRKTRGDIYLIIAGRVLDNTLMPELTRRTKDANIIFRPGFVQNSEVVEYFSSADLCVLPYESVLTSGAAMLSLSLRCPILAPSIGVLPEVVSEGVGILFHSFDDMEQAMEAFSMEQIPQFSSLAFNQLLNEYSWPNVIKNVSFLDCIEN